jgi:sugar phosphate permease
MFYRVSNAIIAPDLIKDLNLNAETLGILGSAFFYSFALLQIPMGILLDRIGPRVVISLFSLVGAIGAFIFALASTFIIAFLGRVLIGIGMASVLMGTLKIFVLRFSPEKFSTLFGIFISIGTLGSILATSPLAYLNSTIGWRATLMFAGGLTFILSFLIFWVLGNHIYSKKKKTLSLSQPEQQISILRSIQLVITNLSFWQISAVSFCNYGIFVALQGLWLGPYLMDIKGFTPIQAGNILLMLSIGSIIGAPMAGYLSDKIFGSPKTVLMYSLSFYALFLIPLTGIWGIESSVLFSTVLFCLGFFRAFGMLTYTHVKELFPLSISGTVIACTNFFVMSGGAVFMQGLGKVIESFPRTHDSYSPQAYHLAFFICFLAMAGSLIFYFFSKEKK